MIISHNNGCGHLNVFNVCTLQSFIYLFFLFHTFKTKYIRFSVWLFYWLTIDKYLIYSCQNRKTNELYVINNMLVKWSFNLIYTMHFIKQRVCYCGPIFISNVCLVNIYFFYIYLYNKTVIIKPSKYQIISINQYPSFMRVYVFDCLIVL